MYIYAYYTHIWIYIYIYMHIFTEFIEKWEPDRERNTNWGGTRHIGKEFRVRGI